MSFNITTELGNVGRQYIDLSSWLLVGTTNETPAIDGGLSAWAIGKISISVTIEPYFQIEFMNESKPTARQIMFEGKYLPNWPRRYRLDVHGVSIGGSIGAALLDSPLKVSVNVRGSFAGAFAGAPVLRHRANGAPPPTGIAGDPTGFLGMGLQGSASGTGLAGFGTATGELRLVQFGSNFFSMCQSISSGNFLDAARRGLGMLLARNHLQFHYSGAWLSAGLGGVLGTDNINILAGNLALNVGTLFVPRLSLFIQHPDEAKSKKWRYVYSRKLQLNGFTPSASPPYKARFDGPKWDQAWI